MRLFLESSSGCLVFDLNQIFKILFFLVEPFWAPLFLVILKNPIPFSQFQWSVTNAQDKCISELYYFTIWNWTRWGTPSRKLLWRRESPKIKISRTSSSVFYLYSEFFTLCISTMRVLFLSSYLPYPLKSFRHFDSSYSSIVKM